MSVKRTPLHAICPYLAMFPASFVRDQLDKYCRKGDWVFDPFCGRGTTLLEALLQDRNAAGSDINPVAFCISKAKSERPTLYQLQTRIDELRKLFERTSTVDLDNLRRALPAFFKRAFYYYTIRELLFLRTNLAWRTSRVDRFIAALVLGS